jgi:hypothetical protein
MFVARRLDFRVAADDAVNGAGHAEARAEATALAMVPVEAVRNPFTMPRRASVRKRDS